MNNFDQLMTELKSGNSSHYYVSPIGYPISPCLYYKGALLDWLCGCAIDVHADIQNISEQETADLAQLLIVVLELNGDGKIPLLAYVALAGDEPYRVGSFIADATAFYEGKGHNKERGHRLTEGFQRLLGAIQQSGVGSVNDHNQAHELCLRAEESDCDICEVMDSEGERLLLISVVLARVAKDLTTSNGVMVPIPSTTQIFIKHDMIEDASKEYSERWLSA